jgi:hypothetical protein
MAGHKCDDDKTIACEGIQYNTIAQDNVYTTRHKDTEWIVFMKTNKGGIPTPDVSSSVVDPAASGYQYMKHSVFAKFAATVLQKFWFVLGISIHLNGTWNVPWIRPVRITKIGLPRRIAFNE